MAGAALPPTVNVLSDSGEKCLVVLYYLASLVEADKTAEIFYNQLVVDHTHEDVDGEFGRGAMHMRKAEGGMILTPQAFRNAMAAAYPENTVWTDVHSIHDWERFFGSNRSGPTTEHSRINASIKGIRTQRVKRTASEASSSNGADSKGSKHSPKAFWLHKHEGKLVLHYKEYDSDPLWMPFLHDSYGNVVPPLATDPAGIPFPSLPQDGLDRRFGRLEEVELRTTATAAPQGAEEGSDGEELLAGDDAEPEAPEGKAVGDVRKKRPPFDPQRCVQAVRGFAASLASTVEAGTSFVNAGIIAEWEAWAAGTPRQLSDLTPEMRPKKTLLALPDCTGGVAPLEVGRTSQFELITWQDSGDPARGLTMTSKQQAALERRAMSFEEVSIGATCLFAPPHTTTSGSVDNTAITTLDSAITTLDETPFWLGDVTRKFKDPEPQVVVHWRGCFVQGSPSADPNGVWCLLCRKVAEDSLHGIPPKKKCRLRGHEPYLSEPIPVASIILHNVGIKTDGHLLKTAMVRIAGLGAQLPRSLTFNGTSTLRVEP